MSEDSSKKALARVPWGPLVAIAATVLIYLCAQVIAAITAVAINYSDGDIAKVLLIYVATSAAMLLMVHIFLRSRSVSMRAFFGKFTGQDVGYVGLYYLVYLAATYMMQTILALVPSYDAAQEQSFGLSGASGIALLGVMVVLVILPPIAEEMMFRGVLYRGMAARWPKVVAALIASVLFGLAHQQWNVGADTFVLSLVVIYALEKRQTLWVPIGIHAVKNLIAYLLVFIVIR